MKNFKKYIIFFGLATSLSLDCSFQVLKKLSKSMTKGCFKIGSACLTTGVLLNGASLPFDKEFVALHESGHAVAAEIQDKNSVTRVCITRDSFGSHGGLCGYSFDVVTLLRLTKDGKLEPITGDGFGSSGLYYDSSTALKKYLCINMAGYAQDLQDKQRQRDLNFLESELGFSLSNIATNTRAQLQSMQENLCYKVDIINATEFAYKIALKELKIEDNDYVNLDVSTKKQIEDRVQQLLIEGLDEAKRIVKAHKKEIHAVAKVLVDRDLSGKDVYKIMHKS